MSQSVTISDLAVLVKDGKLAEAKRAARALLNSADPHDLEVIANCAHILENWPIIGVAKLRWYWGGANEHDRAIIAACAPSQGDQRNSPTHRTKRDPQWSRKTFYRAARDNRPPLRRAEDPEPAIVAAYHVDRAGVDDAPERDERPDGYALDYDRAALAPMRATPCVRCWTERSTVNVTSKQDDGLCDECRDKGRPGIPALSEVHSRADAIEARCAFIAEHYPALAVKLLRRYWHQCMTDDRPTIEAWVKRHHLLSQNHSEDAAPPAAPSTLPGACTSCTERRTLRDLRKIWADDGLCANCRAADEPEADDAHSSASEPAAA